MLDEKVVGIFVPGAERKGSLREVTIHEGTTLEDLQKKLGLGDGFFLASDASGRMFTNPNEYLWSHVTDGEMLGISPRAVAGANLKLSPNTTASVVRQRPLVASANQGVMVRRAEPIEVMSKFDAAWKAKGWREVANGVWEGTFRVPNGTYKGRVEFNGQVFKAIFIWNPPREIWANHHEHAVCFRRVDKEPGKLELHMADKPTSVDSAILNTERILNEAFELGRRHG